MANINKVTYIRNYVCKILPLVYDDSLSYYEVLAKVTAKVNDLIGYIDEELEAVVKELVSKYYISASYDSETSTIKFNVTDTEEPVEYGGLVSNLALENKVYRISADTNTINVKERGIVGDGVTDCTDAVNTLIASIDKPTILYFPKGTYLVREVDEPIPSTAGTGVIYDSLGGIKLNKKGLVIKGDGTETVFKGIDPVGSIGGCIINIMASDCKVEDVMVYGNYGIHTNVCTTGNLKDEWIYGICVHIKAGLDPVDNIHISNVKCYRCHADGINLYGYIGNKPVTNVFIDNCVIETCGRNGVQIGKAQYVFCSNMHISNITDAQTTGSAFDIESHDGITSHIFVHDCDWSNTVQGLIAVDIEALEVSNCIGDGSYSALTTIYGTPHYSGNEYKLGAKITGCLLNKARCGAYTTMANCTVNAVFTIDCPDTDSRLYRNHIRIYDCSLTRILFNGSIKDCVVRGCTVTGNVGYFSANAVCEDVIIASCSFDAFFEMTRTKNCSVIGNLFKAKEPLSFANAGAVYFRYHENLIFDGNVVSINPGDNTNIVRCEQGTGTLQFKNNSIEGYGSTNAFTGAVYLRAGTGISVMDNTILSNAYNSALSAGTTSGKTVASGNTGLSKGTAFYFSSTNISGAVNTGLVFA